MYREVSKLILYRDLCHRRRTQERRGHLQPPAVKLYDTTQLNLMEAAT